jgi:hypothetical protein
MFTNNVYGTLPRARAVCSVNIICKHLCRGGRLGAMGGEARARSRCRFVLPLCAAAPPPHVGVAIMLVVGASVSETTMRPDPTARALQPGQATGGHAMLLRFAPRIILPRVHGRVGTARSKKIVRFCQPRPLRVPPHPPALGLHPIVTSQYSSTTLHQVSYHIQSLLS